MNRWHVYEFCKQHRDILLELPRKRQLAYIRNGMHGVDDITMISGLIEFRSVPQHNWY